MFFPHGKGDIYTENNYVFKRYINEKSIENFKTVITINDCGECITDINCHTLLYNILNLYKESFSKVKINTKYLLSPWAIKGLVILWKRKHKLYEKFLLKNVIWKTRI